MIKVKCKRTGDTIEIAEADFNENLHERIEARTSETVTVSLDDLQVAMRAAADEAATAALAAAGVGTVDRSQVAIPASEGAPNDGNARKPARSAGRTSSRFDQLYRGLPEWERELRTPDIDHAVQDWAIGIMRQDYARCLRAHDKIDELTGLARDLNLSDDATLVPSPLHNVIIEKKRKLQVIGPRANSFTSEATTLEVPTETGFAAAEGVDEGGDITPADPTWGSVTLTKVKSVVSTKSSVEFVEDNAFNAVSFLATGAARTLALRNDAQDMADGDGTGTNQTEALEEASITEVDAAAATFAYTDLTKLWFALLSQYRAGAVWLAGNGVIQVLGDMLDTNDRPIFQPGNDPVTPMSGGQGAPGTGTIFGRPVLEVPASAGVLIVGDLNYYGVLEHPSIRAEFSRDVAFLTDELVWKWVQRRDGAVLQTEAFKKDGGIT